MSPYIAVVTSFILFMYMWFSYVAFVKIFTLDSDVIRPHPKFWTTPIILGGLVILVCYLIYSFHLIVRLTS